MTTNGPDKVVSAIEALSRAIDNVTFSAIEKLESVETRVVGLKESIKVKTSTLKEGIADLMTTIDDACCEADVHHTKIDAVEQSIEMLPKFPYIRTLPPAAQLASPEFNGD